MKHFITPSVICICISLVLLMQVPAKPNWINNSSGQSASRSLAENATARNSMPEGFSKERLLELRDENGNRIFGDEDPGDAMRRKIFTGYNDSYYGYSVSNAGDVNGDGYDDIIVGAPYHSFRTGRAYIYYGGMSMSDLPSVFLTGEEPYGQYGISVSGAGDVNGDGFCDVIVGAHVLQSFTGRAYIYYGGTFMNSVADVIFPGENPGHSFGAAVSDAGDVNGDGYADVIVGAFDYYSQSGRAYIYFGGVTMNNTADVIMTGETMASVFGSAVSNAGDVNGDGYSDVIIGASGYSSNAGRAYIYFGGQAMNDSADLIITGQSGGDYFGHSVSGAGDVNGDGYADVIISAPGYSSNTGRAYIFFGGSSVNDTADVTMTSDAASSLFGFSVSGAGDVNGDGYSDVIIGAHAYNSYTGKAYIYFGGISMNGVDVTMFGEATNSSFGFSVSGAGDVNGDGYADVIVGAFGYGSNTGRVYLYDYFMMREITPDLVMTGEADLNRFGYSVSGAGDVNKDGESDVIVGIFDYGSGNGKAYIFLGGSGMDNTPDVTMTRETAYDNFGTTVSGAGDVNGDGYADVIVGAPLNSSRGKAYIYFGGSVMNNAADVIMTGDLSSKFGWSVSGAGDVNGDGFSDVLIGAPGYGDSTGRACIFLGGSSMNETADVIMNGDSISNKFGSSVSGAGDMNKDGYTDVIVGAYGYGSGAGRAYVFLGGYSMNDTADVVITASQSDAKLGYSVSDAGDVNKDGYSDVIVGSHGSSAGRAYIYYGSPAINGSADVTLTGEVESDLFGFSVSGAGDMNSDGYSDVIIGAPSAGSNKGKSYVFFGGSTMNDSADVTMTGETVTDQYGFSVSDAGDVNGDSYSDVIVGAYAHNSQTGRTYVFQGSAISAKPVLLYVKDVPNDQGGKVNLKWARSSFDVIGNSMIVNYIVYRSYPPFRGGFSWEPVGVLSATMQSFYTYTANTPLDSSANGPGTMFYQIMAATNDSNVYWMSAILSASSIDNIAPPMVSLFSASFIAGNVKLVWNRSTDPDLLNYVLYRSTSPTIDPDTEPVFATTTDSTFLDTSPLTGFYYYFIAAQDIHNNKSPVAVAENPRMTLNLTMFIEGFYDADTNSQVSDTITVELRNAVSPYAVADAAKAIVSAGGGAVLKFGNAASGNYYIAVRHRNAIETWSASAIALSESTPADYDLSSSASQAFGNNVKQVDASPVRFAVYSGDVNQDGIVDVTDLGLIDNDVFSFTSGYVVTDLTGDNSVDISDLLIADNNAYNFTGVIRP